MKKRRIPFDLIVKILLLVLVAVGIYVIADILSDGERDMPSFERQTGETQGTPVRVEPVIPRDLEELYSTYGVLEIDDSIQAFSEANGVVTEVHVRSGDRVAAGDLLFVVDPSVPGQQFALHRVRAPASGTVTNLMVQKNDRIAMNQPVAVIADLEKLLLSTRIPEFYLRFVREGSTAYLTFEALPGTTFQGILSELDFQVNPATRMIGATYELEDAKDLLPGMFARVSVVLQRRDQVLSVPEDALGMFRDERVVFVITEEQHVERRIVTTGLEAAGCVEILSGVDEGEMIVTAGHSGLTDGSRIRIVD